MNDAVRKLAEIIDPMAFIRGRLADTKRFANRRSVAARKAASILIEIGRQRRDAIPLMSELLGLNIAQPVASANASPDAEGGAQ